MKIKSKKPTSYRLTIEMTDKEAINLVRDIGEFKQGEPRVKHSATSKVFMVLADALQDLGLIPMTPNRKKGDNSYPRLNNDEVWVEELNEHKKEDLK